MLQEQLIEEIKQIPPEKLAEVYDLIHYFRLGLAQEKQSSDIKQRPIGLAKGKFEVPVSFLNPYPMLFWMPLKAGHEYFVRYLHLPVANH